MSKGKRANQLWNRLAVPRRVCETKGKLKYCLRVASFSPHSSISRLATMCLYESYSQSRIRPTSLQWYVFLRTTLALCVPAPTSAHHGWIIGGNMSLDASIPNSKAAVRCRVFKCDSGLINFSDIQTNTDVKRHRQSENWFNRMEKQVVSSPFCS